MGIIYILLPASILLAVVGLVAFLWSVRNDQFEDLDTPSKRILFDDENSTKPEKK